MKVAVVQFDSKLGQVQANIQTAERLCGKIAPKSVDLICLPEMCFTGYTFTDSAHITPYLEDPLTGPTSVFCRDLARQKGCYVAAGYAERLGTQETAVVKITREVDEDRWRVKEIRTVEEEVHQVGANSAVVYDPQGVRVGDFRKTNLFETDMTWAKPGTGFKTLHLPPPLNTVTLGICMDLNAQPPAKWTIEGPYEIADHCKSTGTDTLILLNAWLLSGEQERDGRDWGTLNYWATRLRPLWSKSQRRKKSEAAKEGRETKVVICNRCGEENGKIFAGTSSVFSMKQGSDRPVLTHSLSRHEEGVGIWDV